uniref:Ell-associated factor Eaf n=1 Tax=Plectus sambesii TaxID=2011161 RepID=A0A914URC5_9BILA
MAEMKEIPPGSYDLKLGETFGKNPSQVAYQTLRYDFKPKSVSAESETYIAFGDNSDVTIAVPAVNIMEQHLKQSDGPSTAPAPEPTISHKSFAPVKKPNLAADLLLSESSDDDD